MWSVKWTSPNDPSIYDMLHPQFVSGLLCLIYLVLSSSRPNFLVRVWHQSWALWSWLCFLTNCDGAWHCRPRIIPYFGERRTSEQYGDVRSTFNANLIIFLVSRDAWISPTLLLFAEIRDLVHSPHGTKERVNAGSLNDFNSCLVK